MNKHIELYGKTYLRCEACSHHNQGRCKLFDVACSSGDGCQEETIEKAELLHNRPRARRNQETNRVNTIKH